MKYSAALIFALTALGCGGQPPAPAPTPPAPAPAAVTLLDAHNAERAKAGLPPLVNSPALTTAARKHAEFMAAKWVMGHVGIGDGSPWSRIEAEGYAYSAAGENVAWNQPDVATVMKDWMNSPGHRANILGSAYTEFGGAHADGEKGRYWCTVFARPAGVNP